jgi:sialate O-acetylesterase
MRVVAPSPLLAPELRLPRVFSDNMVLQHGKPLPVWGWAAPGETVKVQLGDQEAATQATSKGEWRVTLKPVAPNAEPQTLTVSAAKTIEIKNVLVGEVWIGSGQSNMEWAVGGVNNAQAEIAEANFPNIRLFNIPKRVEQLPAFDVNATWQICTPQTVPGFSAVAYFFGRELHKELNIPVGLIESAWGGTRIEPWTPPVGFAANPKLQDICKTINDLDNQYRQNVSQNLPQWQAWTQAMRQALETGTPMPPQPEAAKATLTDCQQPTALYNGMIHAIVPYAIRGAIWYQGESNNGEGMLYYEKMKALICGWRQVWNQDCFPFLFVQIAPYIYGDDKVPGTLPGLWEAQTASLQIPNTGIAGTADIANLRDIHPTNKQDVGKRWPCGRWPIPTARRTSSIAVRSTRPEDRENKIRLSFDHAGSGLESRDGKALSFFQIAGEDKNFVNADATIDGKTVVVSSPSVAKPVAVRFGWDQRAEPNLRNKEGLPALPFRTDQW